MTRRVKPEKPRPRGYVADASLPAALASPHEAKAYLGRIVCRFFSLEETDSPGWYLGKVISVSVEGDTAFLTVEYEDEDTEELWWSDFVQWAVVEDADMPPSQTDGAGEAGGAAAADPHTPAGATQAAGGTAPRKRRASAAGLDPESPESPTPVRQQRTRSASAGVHVKEEPVTGGAASQQLGPQRSHRSERSRSRGGGEQQAGDEDEGAEYEEGVARPRVRRRLDMDQAVDQAGAVGAAGLGRSSTPAPPAEGAEHGVNAGAGGSRSRAGSHGALPQRQHSQQQLLQQQPAPAAVKKWQVPREPRPAGHLRRIQLVNFMCHHNLEVEFGPHVTFLSGQNGSGKSAVLQGLQACLGASARDTSRGSNLSGWVKVGCNAASVSLEVWNTREEDTAAGQRTVPFKYELYGPVIRILRKIQAKGGGSFQLYNAHGTEVKPAQMGQTAAKEVAALADHFHVDAANPLMIITQDMAARFHQKTSGSGARCSKYEMFMEGTCLAAARDTLAAAAQKLLRAEANMQRQQGRLVSRKQALEQLEAKVKELQQTEDMRRLLGDVEAALMWSTVRESEEGLRAAKASAAAAPARVAALQERLEQQQQAHMQLQEREKSLRAEMDDTRAAQLPARLRELKAAKLAAARQQAAAKREVERLQESIDTLKETKLARERDLQQLAAAGRSDAALQALAAYNERLNAKAAELERVQVQLTELEARRQALAGEQTAAVEQERTAAAARRDADNAVREAAGLRDELAAAAAGGGTDARRRMLTRRWGDAAMRLQEAVRRAAPGTFSRPPFGPVGMYLRRAAGACDERYAALLEHALSNVLDRWIVNRREDSDRLLALAQQAGLGGYRPYINIVPFKDRVHPFAPGPLRDEQSGVVWRRVIDLLQTAPPNEEAMNDTMRATLVCMLLDGAGAASTVLVDDRDTAQWVARGGLQRWDVWTAYDLEGTKYEERNATLITNVRPINTRGMSKLDEVAADKSAQLAEAGRQLAARQAEAGAAAAAHDAAVAEVRRLAGEAADLKKRQVALGRHQARCSAELSTLREETPAAASEAHSAELMNALTQLGSQLQTHESAKSQAENDLNNAIANVNDAEAKLMQAHRDGDSYVARREELVAAVEETGQQLKASAQRLDATQAQLARAREEAAEAQARIDDYERKVEASRAEAEKECSREEGTAALERVKEAKRQRLRSDSRGAASRSAQQLEAEVEAAVTLKALKALVNRTERDLERLEAEGNLETIRTRAEEARASFRLDMEAYKAVMKKVRVMRHSQQLRDVKYDEIRTYAERVVSSKFQSYMLRRNFAASLALSHGPPGRLELSVRPANQQDANATSSLMQLSGGERSFTTVAFLLAVGAMLDSPFRCCDEIDVFMDPSVRKITTAALLEYAWLFNSSSQLVVLSPQDSKTTQECEDGLVRKCQKEKRPVPPKDFCKILVLQPPRR